MHGCRETFVDWTGCGDSGQNSPMKKRVLVAYASRYESMGLLMREDTPENRKKARGFLIPLLELDANPADAAFFGGKLDHGRLNFLWRFAARHDKSRAMQEGDWRDWDAIRAWAGGLAARLF